MTAEKAFQRKTAEMAAAKPADVVMSPNPIETKRAERSELEKELSEKRRELEGIENESPKTYEDLRMHSENAERLIFEAGVLEERIRVIDEEIQTLSVEEKSGIRQSIIEKANDLSKEKKKLLVRLEQINAEGEKLRTQFEENTPKKRIQVESKQFLKWERWIQEDRIEGFSWRGEPVVGKGSPRREETVSDGMPLRVKALLEAGWQLVPGQEEIISEELTPANSREFPMIVTPEIFESFI